MADSPRPRPSFTGKARPAYVTRKSVFDAALDRIRFVFSDFDFVSVSSSGGKDSTVITELALMVARETDRLPLHVKWLDQECELQATVDYFRYLRSRPEIELSWYQVPFRLFNATDHADTWLRVWDPQLPETDWVRPKEPDSVHDHSFHRRDGSKVDRFAELLEHINDDLGGAHLTGMRAEESPTRRLVLTTNATYKYVTWTSAGARHRRFHPIYDWTFRDVWKAIHDHGWVYNSHYDVQFQRGVPIPRMRVSNFHHETALHTLTYLQEVEPQTWEAATRRLAGINSYGQLGVEIMPAPDKLPYMFGSWEEYLEHLIANLCPTQDQRAYREMYARALRDTPPEWHRQVTYQMCRTVIRGDRYGTSLTTYLLSLWRDNRVAQQRRVDRGRQAFRSTDPAPYR